MKNIIHPPYFHESNSDIFTRKKQYGVSLIELMVGISIGLLTVMVAMAALMASRGISGTVSEASSLQQQAAYALRTMGLQARQAGSVQLNLTSGQVVDVSVPSDPLDKVAFEAHSDRKNISIKGKEAPGKDEFKLELTYQNYEEILVGGTKGFLFRNCLGESSSGILIESKFSLDGTELKCKGSDSSQAIIENVKNIQFTYLLQNNTKPGYPTIQKLKASDISSDGWSNVLGIEVCLELMGTERIDTAGQKYMDCDGKETDLGNKLHMVFRNTYQIRSQGSPI